MPQSETDQAEQKLRQWIEAALGRVVEFGPLPGWRPAWNASVETPAGIIGVHIRGDRDAGQEMQPLRREYDVLCLLESEGIPVPKMYGWCDDPAAIVMERVDAQAYLGGADSDPNLHRLTGDYMAIMAAVHRIDIDKAFAIGMTRPQTPRDIALAYFGDTDRHYESHRTDPQPLIAFVRKWIFDHLPLHRTQTALLIADAPQFFHDGERVTHIFDLELAHVGDPMADLASVRVRDINEPIGGMTQLLQRYVAESGNPIDWPALDFHTIAAFLTVPMRVGSILTQSQLPAYVEYLSWYLGCCRAAIEVLADVCGVALAPVADVEPVETPDSILYSNLMASCADLPPGTGRLREAPALSLARYLQRKEAIGGAIARRDLEEVEQLLGEAFATAQAADEALEAFVFRAGPEQDAALIGLFHRRTMRALQMLRGYPGPIVERGPSPVDRAAFSLPGSDSAPRREAAIQA